MIKDDMQYLTIALPKGKLFYLAKDLFAKVGFVADNLEEKSRKLVITNEELKLKFIIKLSSLYEFTNDCLLISKPIK